MRSRVIRWALALALFSACTPAEPVVPTDVRGPEVRSVSVEVELLELPLEPAVERADDALESDKGPGVGKARLSRVLELFKGESKGEAKDGDRVVEGDGAVKDPAESPPPPPPIEAPPLEKNDKQKLRAIKQATGESVGGRVEPASIQEAVAKDRERFSRCLSTDSKLVMEATISSSGDVVDAHSSSSQPDDPKLRDCVVDVFKRLRFKPLDTPQQARVKFAIALKRTVDY